jgi:acyl carrier protein
MREIVMRESPPVNQIVASQDRIHANAGRSVVHDRINSSVRERASALVQVLLAKRSISRPVRDNDDLGESGLSSLDLVNLMLAVEAEFDLKIPEREMRPANFRSLAQIEALVTALLRAGEPVEG